MLTMAKELKFRCNLKKIMQDRDLSAAELNRRSGVALTTIRTLTNGGTLDRIDRGSTGKIMDYIGCEFGEMWDIDWADD